MKKFLKTILVLAAMTAVVFSLAACGEEGIVPVGLTAVPIVDQHTASDGTLLLESSVDAAEFTGGGIGASAAMTKTYSDIFAQRALQYIEEETARAEEYFADSGLTDTHSTYTLSTGVIRSDDRVFVLSVNTESFSAGAAHGGFIREAVCFDPNNGNILALNSLTADGSDPTAKLAELLAEKYMLSEYAEGFGYDAGEAAEVITAMLADGMNQWYITDEFVLICNAYDLAPYAMGSFELKLTAAELEGIVDSRWFA